MQQWKALGLAVVRSWMCKSETGRRAQREEEQEKKGKRRTASSQLHGSDIVGLWYTTPFY